MFSRVASVAALILCLLFVSVQPASAVSVSYSGSKAVQYANLYACNSGSCPNYRNYKTLTNDCTNFMSQAVNYGGVPTDEQWAPYTTDWSYVVEFYSWLKTHLLLTVKSQYSGSQLAATYTSAEPGDIFMYDWGKGDLGFSHMSMEAGFGKWSSYYGTGSGDYMDQHTTDRYHAPWNYGYLHPDSTIDRSHMRVWVLDIHGRS